MVTSVINIPNGVIETAEEITDAISILKNIANDHIYLNNCRLSDMNREVAKHKRKNSQIVNPLPQYLGA